MILPLVEFGRNKSNNDGLMKCCRPCNTTYHRAYYHRTIELRRAQAKQHRDADPARQKVYRARWKARYPANEGLWLKRYRANNPEKYAAHKIVRVALTKGVLIPRPCEKCGKKAQAHHDDYSKPLEVRWLCVLHHREHHKLDREAL